MCVCMCGCMCVCVDPDRSCDPSEEAGPQLAVVHWTEEAEAVASFPRGKKNDYSEWVVLLLAVKTFLNVSKKCPIQHNTPLLRRNKYLVRL